MTLSACPRPGGAPRARPSSATRPATGACRRSALPARPVSMERARARAERPVGHRPNAARPKGSRSATEARTAVDSGVLRARARSLSFVPMEPAAPIVRSTALPGSGDASGARRPSSVSSTRLARASGSRSSAHPGRTRGFRSARAGPATPLAAAQTSAVRGSGSASRLWRRNAANGLPMAAWIGRCPPSVPLNSGAASQRAAGPPASVSAGRASPAAKAGGSCRARRGRTGVRSGVRPRPARGAAPTGSVSRAASASVCPAGSAAMVKAYRPARSTRAAAAGEPLFLAPTAKPARAKGSAARASLGPPRCSPAATAGPSRERVDPTASGSPSGTAWLKASVRRTPRRPAGCAA